MGVGGVGGVVGARGGGGGARGGGGGRGGGQGAGTEGQVPVTSLRRAWAAAALRSAWVTRALARAEYQSASGTGVRDRTTPRTSRQISVTGWPRCTASDRTWSSRRTTILDTWPGRPFIRSDIERSRSTTTVPGGSASLSDSVSTWAEVATG